MGHKPNLTFIGILNEYAFFNNSLIATLISKLGATEPHPLLFPNNHFCVLWTPLCFGTLVFNHSSSGYSFCFDGGVIIQKQNVYQTYQLWFDIYNHPKS
jgi:hypothetical protein